MPALKETASQPALPNRFRRLRWAILAVGILVILAFAASSCYDAWHAYDNQLSATGREIDNESKALAEQTAWAFQAVDLLLEDTARWFQTDGLKSTPEHIDEVLANRASGVRQIRMLTITDARGIRRYRSGDSSPSGFRSLVFHRTPRPHRGWRVHERTADHQIRESRGDRAIAAPRGWQRRISWRHRSQRRSR
jgi:hypothetical protein